MKIAITSDLHVEQWPEFSVGDSRLTDCVSVLSDIRNYCLKHKITCLVIGGDLFHKPGVLHTKSYNVVVHELAEFKKHDIRVLCIPGNHDMADKAGKTHAVEALHKAGLVEGLVKASLATWHHEDLVIQGFPYCDSKDEFQRRIDLAHKKISGPRIGIFHHGFKGALVGTHLEYEVKEPISAKRLRGTEFVHVFSGHYHHHQPILGKRDAVYIGSPLEHSRSNRDEVTKKGFIVYDADVNTFKIVPLKRPRFVTLTQEQLDAEDFSRAVDNFVDVTWSGFAGGKDRLEECLKEAGAKAWKLLERSVRHQEVRETIDPTASPAEAWKNFMASRKKDVRSRGLNWKKIVRLGLEALQKAGEDV